MSGRRHDENRLTAVRKEPNSCLSPPPTRPRDVNLRASESSPQLPEKGRGQSS